MNFITLEKLTNIKKDMELNSQKNKDNNSLLDESIFNNYNIVEIKKKLKKLFDDFQSAKYLFPFEETGNVISCYEYGNKRLKTAKSSKVEKIVDNFVDQQMRTTEIYYALIKVCQKLTHDEFIYLTGAFMNHHTEENIAELIGISKTYLQKIKKSCIVKIWIDLRKFC